MLLLFLLACQPATTVADTAEPEPDTEPWLSPALDDLDVQLHPGQGAMLDVSWEQREAGQTRVVAAFDGEEVSGPGATLEPGRYTQTIVGVPFGTTAEVRIELDEVVVGTVEVRTASVPYGLPTTTLAVADADAWEPTLQYLLVSMDGSTAPERDYWAMVIDRRGRPVWAEEAPEGRIFLHPQVSRDGGSILLDHNSFWGLYDEGRASTVVRQTLDGDVLETIATPGLHHPFTELPDGRLAWGAVEGHGDDEHIMIEDGKGGADTLWSCSDVGGTIDTPDGCISNTLRYDDATDRFLFSFFTLETVFEIDGSSGETIRWFGHFPGSWAFDPPQAAFWWQHGVHITDAGTMLVSTKGADAAEETLVREYRLDADTQTLTQVWSFGEGEAIYGRVLGEAWRLPGGNTLHNMGSASRIREITPDGVVVWDVLWQRDKWVGRSTALQELAPLLSGGGGIRGVE